MFHRAMRVQKTRDTQHIFAVGTGSLLPENIKKMHDILSRRYDLKYHSTTI